MTDKSKGKRPRAERVGSAADAAINDRLERGRHGLDMANIDDDATEGLLVAARAVVAAWEHGDLAAAVRELDAALNGGDSDPDEIHPGWSSSDAATATAEGWNIFENSDGTRTIQADSDSTIFVRNGVSHDDAAVALVQRLAAAGSHLHRRALAIHAGPGASDLGDVILAAINEQVPDGVIDDLGGLVDAIADKITRAGKAVQS